MALRGLFICVCAIVCFIPGSVEAVCQTALDAFDAFDCNTCTPEPYPIEGLSSRCGVNGADENSNCTAFCQDLIDDVESACAAPGSFDAIAFENIMDATYLKLAPLVGVCTFQYTASACDAALIDYSILISNNFEDCGRGAFTDTACTPRCKTEINTLLDTCEGVDFLVTDTPDGRDFVRGDIVTWTLEIAGRDGIQKNVWDKLSDDCNDFALSLIPTTAPTKAPVTPEPTKAPIIPTNSPTKAPGNEDDDDQGEDKGAQQEDGNLFADPAVMGGVGAGAAILVCAAAAVFTRRARKSNAQLATTTVTSAKGINFDDLPAEWERTLKSAGITKRDLMRDPDLLDSLDLHIPLVESVEVKPADHYMP